MTPRAAADRACEPEARRSFSDGALLEEVLAGLAARPRRLSPMWFYDARGSHLFERICELPEYYLTRAETSILERYGADIAAHVGPEALLVEYGSGASTKTRLLLDRLERPVAYVPVDISREHLLAAAERIAVRYPGLEVLPHCADFTAQLTLPRVRRAPRRTALFFSGSTLGNFDPHAARALLSAMRATAGEHGCLVLSVDLLKDRERLRRAYDDAQGLTAEFNRNALLNLNKALGADFDVEGFRHAAVWNEEHRRIEMHLVATRRHTVHLAGRRIVFEPGEPLVTEHCYKYTVEGCAGIARAAGWSLVRSFTDPRGDFAVLYLEAAAAASRLD